MGLEKRFLNQEDTDVYLMAVYITQAQVVLSNKWKLLVKHSLDLLVHIKANRLIFFQKNVGEILLCKSPSHVLEKYHSGCAYNTFENITSNRS